MATPFVQGRLWQAPLFVDIQTICAHCAWPIHFRLDSALQFQVHTAGAEPLVFEPQINWASFAAPNIIQAY
jgi:hypothetical protein